MPKETQQSGSVLPLLIIGALFYFFTRPAIPPGPVVPDPEPSVVVAEKMTPDQVWEALAVVVEKKAVGGELQQHTDHLLKIVDILKESGSIPDTARVDQWRAKRIEITDANRADIVRQIRGK